MPRVRKTKKGAALKRWFKEKWTDEKGNPCEAVKQESRSVGHQERFLVVHLRLGPNWVLLVRPGWSGKEEVGMGRRTRKAACGMKVVKS